jgi:hypothetical protein
VPGFAAVTGSLGVNTGRYFAVRAFSRQLRAPVWRRYRPRSCPRELNYQQRTQRNRPAITRSTGSNYLGILLQRYAVVNVAGLLSIPRFDFTEAE